jgi:hypothetical protein
MAQTLYRAVYCSRSKLDGTPERMAEQLQTILATSRRNNSRVNLSGALLFASDCFAQALEGERGAIEQCFERIQIDPRHADVTVLEFAPAPARDFSDWSMAFAGDPAAKESDPLAIAVFKDAFVQNHADSGSAVLRLLRQLVRQEELWALA